MGDLSRFTPTHVGCGFDALLEHITAAPGPSSIGPWSLLKGETWWVLRDGSIAASDALYQRVYGHLMAEALQVQVSEVQAAKLFAHLKSQISAEAP